MADLGAPATTGLAGTRAALAADYDVALLDLDGVVYIGASAVPHARGALEQARALGMRTAFVTNNASRTPQDVATHLVSLGVPAEAAEVVTSAQAAARLLADRLPTGSRVLVVGAHGLVQAVEEQSLEPVSSAQENPVAVVQGYGPDVGWRALAEAAHAVNAGALWVATNGDLTIPTTQGRAPGNGALIAAVRVAVDVDPLVAGKPELPLHQEAVHRSGARRPLVVGDRLDTDIEGACRAGVDSLLVLTGVTTPVDLVLAPPGLRPTYVADDLRGLLVGHPPAAGTDGTATCGRWRATVGRGALTIEERERAQPPLGTGRDEERPAPNAHEIDALRAACAAVWSAAKPVQAAQVRSALERAAAGGRRRT